MSTANTFPSYSSLSPEISKIPMFRTNIIEYGNKVEQRVALDSTARYRFDIVLNDMTSANAATFVGFFISQKGRYDNFRFVNVIDNTTHTCRFDEDVLNLSYFNYKLYGLKTISLVEVST